jgi:hypothetical protein
VARKRAALYIEAQHLALSQGAFLTLYNELKYKLIKPYVHGLVTTEAYVDAVAKERKPCRTRIRWRAGMRIALARLGRALNKK